jgi:hypothetical protein
MATFPQTFPFWFDSTLEPGVEANQVDTYRYFMKIKDSSGVLQYEMDLMEEAVANEELNTPTELNLTISVEDIAITGLVENNFIYIYDRSQRLYNVFEIASIIKAEGDGTVPQYQIIGYDRLNRLSKDLILEYNLDEESKTYEEYMTDFLSATYQVNDNKISSSIQNIDPDILSKSIVYTITQPVTILEAIIQLEELFEERSAFWVDADSDRLYWKLFTNITDNGYRLEFENNLLEIEQEKLYEERITRLYAYGGNIDIETDVKEAGETEEVIETTSRPVKMSDSDSYAFDYVTDGSGENIKSAFLTASHITNPDTLRQWAKKQLKRYHLSTVPTVYTGSAIEISKASVESAQWMSLGDPVKVTAPNLSINDQQLYVTGVERSLIDVNNVILTISDEKKDWVEVIKEAEQTQTAVVNGFDNNPNDTRLDDIETNIDDIEDDVDDLQWDFRAVRYLTPVVTDEENGIDPNTPVYVYDTFEASELGIDPQLTPTGIIYWIRKADYNDDAKQAIGITHKTIDESVLNPPSLELNPPTIVSDGVVCFGVYYVDTQLYGVGALQDRIYLGDGVLLSSEPEGHGSVLTQHIATCLRVEATGDSYYFANCRSKFREANDIYVRNYFDGQSNRLQHVAEGTEQDDVVVLSQLNQSTGKIYLTPVVAAGEDIDAGQLVTTNGSASIAGGGTGTGISVASAEEDIAGIAIVDMTAGETYYNSVVTHGTATVPDNVLAVGAPLYAADDGAVVDVRDINVVNLTKIGMCAYAGPTDSVVTMDIQGSLTNPNELESRKIDNSNVYGTPADYEILTDLLRCESGNITYLSGNSLVYSSGNISAFVCGSFRLTQTGTEQPYYLQGDNDGNGSWVPVDTLNSSLDHGELGGLTDDDHPQYVLHTEFDGEADSWFATKTTDDLSEGAVNFYYTEARFNTSFAGKTTTDLAEGSNLYYTDARATSNFNSNFPSAFDTAFAGKSTSDLVEGSNLYYTEARVSANTSVAANSAHRTTTTGNPHQISWTDIDGNVANDGEILIADGAGRISGNSVFKFEDSANSGRVGIGIAAPLHKIHCLDATSNVTSNIHHEASTGTAGGATFTAISANGSGVFGTFANSHVSYGGYTILKGDDTNIKVIGSGIATEFGIIGAVSGLATVTAKAGSVWCGSLIVDDGTYSESGTKTGGAATSVVVFGPDNFAGGTVAMSITAGIDGAGSPYVSGAKT